jgi:hypothetical protein
MIIQNTEYETPVPLLREARGYRGHGKRRTQRHREHGGPRRKAKKWMEKAKEKDKTKLVSTSPPYSLYGLGDR